MTTTASTTTLEGPRARLTPLPDGPYQVTGPIDIVGGDGQPIQTAIEQIHLCRCGQSASKPFCDGSHVHAEWKER